MVADEIVVSRYRVQAMAEIAKHAPDSEVERLLMTAVEHAGNERDMYRRAAVLAWPIDSALARQHSALASRVIQQFEQQIGSVEPLLSRASAILLVLDRAATHHRETTLRLAISLLEITITLQSSVYAWRQKWGMTYVNRLARRLGRADPALAKGVLLTRLPLTQVTEILTRNAGGI